MEKKQIYLLYISIYIYQTYTFNNGPLRCERPNLLLSDTETWLANMGFVTLNLMLEKTSSWTCGVYSWNAHLTIRWKALCIRLSHTAMQQKWTVNVNKEMLWKISSPGFSCTRKAAQLLNKSTQRTRVTPINSYTWKEEDCRCSFWSLPPHFWHSIASAPVS